MNRTTVRAGFYATIVLLLLFAIPVMADQTPITIKPGTLQETLDAYSKATGTKTVYLNELIEGKNSPGSQNAASTDALQQILQGTGLTFEMAGNDTAVLKKEKPAINQKKDKTEKPSTQQPRREMKLGELTVTANKVEENIQEVPISMTAFDEFSIEDRKIESIQDVASYTSNFTLIDRAGGVSFPSIRGIANTSGGGSQPASVIIDGIPVSSSQGFNVSLMDIERIEVLKGPQGTLYGKEAQAGVINVITKKPTNETRGKIGVELGEDNKRQYTLSASGSIVEDKLYVGVAAKHYEKDGFIKDTVHGGYVNDRENNYGRLHLRYTPIDDLEVSLISSMLKQDDGDIDYLNASEGYKSKSTNTQGYDKSDTTSHALKVSYDINDYLFESITTYRNVDLNQLQGYSWGGYHFLRDDKKSSQEFRLSNSSDTFKWVAGLYTDKTKHNDTSYMVGESTPPSTDKGDSLGAFIHTDYAINDKLSFISGARYDKDNKKYEQSTTKLDFSDSEISPKVSLKYQQDINNMYYTTISKGYRSGGFTSNAPSGKTDYKSEVLWNYEIGAKNTFFDNRLVVNSSVFYMQVDDMQVRVYTGPNSRMSYIDNAAKATSKGFELGVNGKITDSLELFGSCGYTDATLDEYSDAKGDYSGNKKTYAPDYNYTIGVQYRGAQGIFARVDLNGHGKMYFDNANNNSRDPYEIVNAKIGYEAEDYEIYLYGKNIFDKEYYSISMFNFGGTKYSQPREIGVQLAYRF